jgi:GNAT superfamily N-acetyltransferase
MKKLFFNHEFLVPFTWREIELRIGCVHTEHQKKISEGLHNLSSSSIRYRFLGSKNDFSQEELRYLTEIDGMNHFALGVEEQDGKKRGIGIIRMVRSSKDLHQSEVAITVIDDYQKMGLGTFLLRLLILAARERNIDRLSFTFMPTNQGIQKLIQKMGQPLAEIRHHDSVEIIMEISAVNVIQFKSLLVKILPEIENFHLKT